MHGMLHVFLLILYFLPQLFAAPPSSITHVPSNSSANSTATSTIISHNSSHHHITTHRPISPTTRYSHNPQIITTYNMPTIPRHRPPAPTHTSGTSDSSRSKHPHRQKPIVIFFEVLCGLFAFGFLLGLLRCLYSYRKTPNRDRIMGVINRHRLQQELEELERNPLTHRRVSIQEPAPPYVPRPPSYSEHSHIQTPVTIEYTEVSTTSPPSSPLIRSRSQETSELRPPLSNG